MLTVHGVGETLYALHEHERVGTICVQPVGKQYEGVQLEPRRLSSYLFVLVLQKDVVEAEEEASVFCARQERAGEGLRRGRVREASRNMRTRERVEATYLPGRHKRDNHLQRIASRPLEPSGFPQLAACLEVAHISLESAQREPYEVEGLGKSYEGPPKLRYVHVG